ncbi:MAG: TadE family protein [Anaerolineales bacterium]
MAVGLRALRARLARNPTIRRAQSLVEFSIMLPVLLIMLSGVIEMGFMLNSYLDVIDAARETARFAANDDPIRADSDGSPLYPNPNFYLRVFSLAKESLKSGSDGRIDWNPSPAPPLPCDPVEGDVVVSSFAVLGAAVEDRFPLGAPNGQSMCGNYISKFTYARGDPIYTSAAINSGLVVVEIFYEYDQVLALPWITAFVPDPVTLYAYSFMPNINVEPTSTP